SCTHILNYFLYSLKYFSIKWLLLCFSGGEICSELFHCKNRNHLATSSIRKESIIGARIDFFSFNELRFAIHLAESENISSFTINPFSFNVLPVSTISTISSANPKRGANSTDPSSFTMSIDFPCSRKYFVAIFGYFVAIRCLPPRTSEVGRPATANRHLPKGNGSRSNTSG